MKITKIDSQTILPSGNRFIGTYPILENSSIIFNGHDNVLYCDNNVKIANSIIKFEGDNNLIYLSSNKHIYYLNISIYNNSICYFGNNNYINGRLNIILSEQKHFIVGNDGLFSFDIWVRTADPHLIYDASTGVRINDSKSVFLGDHVWIGQHALLLKGSTIGSGSIIGAMSLLSGKTIESNSCYGGNPVKRLASNVFFTKDCVHSYRATQTRKSKNNKGNDFIYSYDSESTLSFSRIEEEINNIPTSKDRLSYLSTKLSKENKNRFYIKYNNTTTLLSELFKLFKSL